MLSLAEQASNRAYAPYSNYSVGVAILTENGEVFQGANIENISYGATICAERTAIANMRTGGDHRIHTVAVHTPDHGWPCGICLQTIAEFAIDADSTRIVVPSENGFIERSLRELAPYLWSSALVKKK
ncbi:MAG: cytidine deaminase [Fimbriimonas sp.]|jgi:cytidine deaminase|nr:cytidine deaminase [Fimbriimonas sp.]